MDFRFPKRERLKSKKQIEQLFKEGSTVSAFPLKLIYNHSATSSNIKVRVAVAVPKKSFKSAVARNRIKRLIRESYRLNKHGIFNNIEGNFAFLFLYLGKEMPEYAMVESSMLKIFNKFQKKMSDAKVAE